jgi:hypothetical protein
MDIDNITSKEVLETNNEVPEALEENSLEDFKESPLESVDDQKE